MMQTLPTLLLDLKTATAPEPATISGIFGERTVIDVGNENRLANDFSAVKYALVWKPEADLFDRLPNLEVIFSLGAGVDHILEMGSVPDLPIVRFVDPSLTTRMSEWVSLQCLMHLRSQRVYDRQQRNKDWTIHQHPQASDLTVGIMGMGVLGQDSAQKLKTLGFNVIGWSRTKKHIDGIECFSLDELSDFLGLTDYLVGLLPFTAETKDLFNTDIFSKLRQTEALPAPVFINAGRGGSQVEADIIEALKAGVLQGVSLDVFEAEPLSEASPLWSFEQAILTPHVAADSNFGSLFRHVQHQIGRYESGLELEYLVDRSLGY